MTPEQRREMAIKLAEEPTALEMAKAFQETLSELILKEPSGETRNSMCDENINALLTIHEAEMIVAHGLKEKGPPKYCHHNGTYKTTTAPDGTEVCGKCRLPVLPIQK